LDAEQIRAFEQEGSLEIQLDEGPVTLETGDIEVVSQDIPGWLVAVDGELTVAMDMTISEALAHEGMARELVNKVQNLRKDLDYELTDRIRLTVEAASEVAEAIDNNKDYICAETLAESLELVETLDSSDTYSVLLVEGVNTRLSIERST